MSNQILLQQSLYTAIVCAYDKCFLDIAVEEIQLCREVLSSIPHNHWVEVSLCGRPMKSVRGSNSVSQGRMGEWRLTPARRTPRIRVLGRLFH